MAYLLGIDTGGTYTDAVIFEDEERRVVASAKSLTTKQDLSICVRNAVGAALEECPPEVSGAIALVSLSTTLATNAIVEQHGFPVGLILIGQSDTALDRAGLRQALGSDPVIHIAGGHQTDGTEQAPLGETAAREALSKLKHKANAFAVSSYFATRNPTHEIRMREIVREETGLPVTCAHEMANALDAPRRALTALLNARLVPLIQHLIDAVGAMLDARGITAPLMVVKGDGSLISAETALFRPVETILSGPAASVVGARFLSGREDVVVSDIGGTTTDIAVLSGGRPVLDPDGATVGGYRTMVEAVAVHTVGLGGDSEIGLDDEFQLRVGPRRVVPLSLLAHEHPEIRKVLEVQLARPWPKPVDGRFALRLRAVRDESSLSKTEGRIWQALADGPKSLEDLLSSRTPEQPLRRLVDRGLVILAGFTPSDAAHVLGLQDTWDAEAARLAATLTARTERRPGIPLAPEGETLAHRVLDKLAVQSGMAIVEAALAEDDRMRTGLAAGTLASPKPLPARRFLSAALQDPQQTARIDADHPALLDFQVALKRPLVGIGAPARTHYPSIARRLNTELVIPDHADVCNAVGAVAGGVSQAVTLTITSPSDGVFNVHGTADVEQFLNLEEAAARAEALARAESRARADQAGADEIRIEVDRQDKSATVAGSLTVFIESRITARAFGRPRISTHG